MEKQTILPKIANSVLKKKRKPLTYCGLMKTWHKPVWERALDNELGCHMQGVGSRIKGGTKTLVPIAQNKMPSKLKAAYAKIVVDIQSQKKRRIGQDWGLVVIVSTIRT